MYNFRIAKFLNSPGEISKYHDSNGQNNTFIKEKVFQLSCKTDYLLTVFLLASIE